MSRLSPLTTIFFWGLITCCGWAEQEPLPRLQGMTASQPESPALQHVLDLIEHVDNRLEELSGQRTIAESVALAGASALLFIAYNAVRHKLLSHLPIDYRKAAFLAQLTHEEAAYHWILAIFDTILPASVAGSLITTLSESDPHYPSIPAPQALKAQIISMMAFGIPGTLAQFLFSRTRLAPYLSGNQSGIFQTVMLAGPFVTTAIYSALSRMTLEEQKLYKQLQLKNLHNRLSYLVPHDEIQTPLYWEDTGIQSQ